MTFKLPTAVLQLALASVCLVGARASAAEAAQATQAPSPVTPRRHGPRSATGRDLEGRVRLLAKSLDLDARQQAQLRLLLESQREAISRVWGDPAIPADDRVGATRAILRRTEDRIRALLNEEQRKKYPAAAGPRDATPPPDVEYWLRLTQARRAGGAARPN